MTRVRTNPSRGSAERKTRNATTSECVYFQTDPVRTGTRPRHGRCRRAFACKSVRFLWKKSRPMVFTLFMCSSEPCELPGIIEIVIWISKSPLHAFREIANKQTSTSYITYCFVYIFRRWLFRQSHKPLNRICWLISTHLFIPPKWNNCVSSENIKLSQRFLYMWHTQK